jgi:hypothetical protein
LMPICSVRKIPILASCLVGWWLMAGARPAQGSVRPVCKVAPLLNSAHGSIRVDPRRKWIERLPLQGRTGDPRVEPAAALPPPPPGRLRRTLLLPAASAGPSSRPAAERAAALPPPPPGRLHRPSSRPAAEPVAALPPPPPGLCSPPGLPDRVPAGRRQKLPQASFVSFCDGRNLLAVGFFSSDCITRQPR